MGDRIQGGAVHLPSAGPDNVQQRSERNTDSVSESYDPGTDCGWTSRLPKEGYVFFAARPSTLADPFPDRSTQMCDPVALNNPHAQNLCKVQLA